jgi:hypothetical protein
MFQYVFQDIGYLGVFEKKQADTDIKAQIADLFELQRRGTLNVLAIALLTIPCRLIWIMYPPLFFSLDFKRRARNAFPRLNSRLMTSISVVKTCLYGVEWKSGYV